MKVWGTKVDKLTHIICVQQHYVFLRRGVLVSCDLAWL